MEKVKEYVLHGIEDIPTVAAQFLEEFGHRKIFAFDAEMGTGKTTFITGLLKAMGIEHPEGSPTYAIVNSYDSPMYGKAYHFDVYRFNDISEAYDIGMEEMLYEGAYCFIEWPEKISDLLPDNTIWVYIRKNTEGDRIISIEA